MKRICSLALILTLLLAMIPGAAAAPEQPKLTSAAAYVMDYDTGSILYAKNETTLRAPASTTQLLTAYLVFDAMAAGWFSEDTLVPVSEAAYAVANERCRIDSNWSRRHLRDSKKPRHFVERHPVLTDHNFVLNEGNGDKPATVGPDTDQSKTYEQPK